MPKPSGRSTDSAPNDGFELKQFRRHRVEGLESLGDNASDDGTPGNARRCRSSHSSESTIQTFQLYTPDEEKAVVRKLDRNVVFFMSFLYLLSFLDRSSMHSNLLRLLETSVFDWDLCD